MLVKLKTLDVGANRLRSMEGVGSLVEVRACESRSDELRRGILGALTDCSGTFVCNVSAPNSDAFSYDINPTLLTHSLWDSLHSSQLEHLWMGKNKITQVCDLDNLKKLRRLDVQSNR